VTGDKGEKSDKGEKGKGVFFCTLVAFVALVALVAYSKESDRLDRIEAKVVSVLPDPTAKGWLVVLAPQTLKVSGKTPKKRSRRETIKDPSKVLVIGIGEAEGTSILLAMNKKRMIRPMTHDTFAKILKRAKVKVSSCLIHTMSDNTFFARLDLIQNGKKFTVDSRPSDGIALVLRSGGKIYVLRKIFDEAGIDWPPKDPLDAPHEDKL